MACAHCATSTFITPLASHISIHTKPRKLTCSIPTPSSSKPSKRKNTLRPKLLETLKKTYIKTLDSPHEQQPQCSSDQLSAEVFPNVAGEEQECESDVIRQSETSVSAGVIDDGVGILSTGSMFKAGLFFIGAIVFQTIVSVWILGSADSDETRDLELGMDEENEAKTEFSLNGSGNLFSGKLGIQKDGIVYVDESELEKKIVEIREMARDVREKEGVKSKENGLDDDDDDDIVVKTGIEKEVDNRLVNLRKSLKKIYRKPLFSAGYLSTDGKVRNRADKDEFNAKMANDALMYKKKHRFRSSSTGPSGKPKGFQRSEDDSVMKLKSRLIVRTDEVLKEESVASNNVDLLRKDQQLDLQIGGLKANVSMALEEDEGKKAPNEETKSLRTTRKKSGKEKDRTKPGKEMGVHKTQPLIGYPSESTYERSPVRGVKSGKSINLEAQNSQGFTKEKQDKTTIPNSSDVLSRESSLKGVKLGNKIPAKEVENKKSDTETDPWWFSLPYALVILMRGNGDGEGPVGLYTFNGTSRGKGDSSYTVAFEDRGDATNFCYLLQSFFEDTEDFSAEIIPLSIKDMAEEVQSHNMKVLVVKKGKLQLYAGQPLEEAERALCSLIGQS